MVKLIIISKYKQVLVRKYNSDSLFCMYDNILRGKGLIEMHVWSCYIILATKYTYNTFLIMKIKFCMNWNISLGTFFVLTWNCISGVKISVLASSAVNCGFKPQSDKTKDS